jgi:uncharacterized membrane protein (DUF485 family)
MKRMMMKKIRKSSLQNYMGLRPYALGHALGMMSIIVLVFYGLFVWFSNYESAFIIAKYPISFSFYDWTLIFGLVQSYVLFYVLGWVFARLYNSS